MAAPATKPTSNRRQSGKRSGPPVPERRRYQQYCGVARALDVIGERWSLLIVRNLLLGPRRYSDLLAELPGITSNLLAKRLSELSAAAILERVELPAPLSATVYRLAPFGASLEPVVMELGRWGGRLMGELEPEDTFNIGWALLSMKRRYVGGSCAVVELVIGAAASDETEPARRFELAFSPGYLSVQERAAVRPELTVAGSLETVRTWLLLGGSSEQLRNNGALSVSGDERRWCELKSVFGLSD